MSPHVGNFVADLVEMARATEELPQVRKELEGVRSSLNTAEQTIQDRELRIIELKAEVDRLSQKVRDAEVARDDAELRFLELDEKSSKVVKWLHQIGDLADSAEAALEPPMPEPIKEPEANNHPQDVAGNDVGFSQDASQTASASGSHSTESPSVEGQRVADPTSAATNVNNSSSTEAIGDTASSAESKSAELGPYSGKKYIDVPGFVSRYDWLAGGGTEADYDWREPALR